MIWLAVTALFVSILLLTLLAADALSRLAAGWRMTHDRVR